MQFDHEESGEERRRRQRDYHAFLDAQVEARRKAPPQARDDVEAAARLPILPASGRLKHQPNPPLPGGDANLTFAKYGDTSRLQAPRGADGGGGDAALGGNLDRAGVSSYQVEYLNKLEQRLETEVQRRGLLERKVGSLGQKLQNWMADSTASISSLGARDAAVTEVREQARHLDAQLARVQERQHRIETTLSLAPKVQEMTQQQVKALEEEARTRIQADEIRAARFGKAMERVLDEVQSLAARVGSEENGTSQRVAILEAALTGEAKGTREATKQLGEHVKALGAAYSGSESNMDVLCQSLRRLEARQEEQHVFAGGITEQLVARQQNQELMTTATSERLDALKASLANELSGMMADTAKRVVESTNVPQAITLLKGRVEITEERLANMADKSFRSLEEELVGLRVEVTRLERKIDADPAAADLAALGSSMTTAQEETQSQLRELQDTLSAEITARRRNALRLAEAQAASTEGGRESAVQTASGLRARCLELEELVVRLTQDVHTAQAELSSQTQAQLSATQERNSRAVGKLEESFAGIRRLVAQQDADKERNWAKSSARADDLEALIADTKDSLREADERSRSALAAMEARRQAQAQQLSDNLAAAKSEEMARTEAVELSLGEHRHATREAVEAGYRANRTRSDELHAEMQGLEERLTAMVEDAQRKESARAEAILHKTHEQVNREVSRVRQSTDRIATDTQELRVQVLAEETSRLDDVQSLKRDVSKATEAAESRMRLWAEERLQSERATTEEVLERAQAQSGMVRTLLDEAVSAISKELNMQKAESKARSAALEELLDELVSGLEARLTEVDNGAAKKRRLGDLTEETGARIGEIERHVRQAEKELKDDLEVKLAVSSLVCAVSDKASTERLNQRASEELKLEKKRIMRATTNEGKLKAELGKTNATVSSLQSDLGAATAWRRGVDELESKLMARIEELKATAEAARSAAATATADAAAARKAETEAALAREEAAAELARAKEAAEGDTGALGQPIKKTAAKKVTDFAAMNDELEADDSSASSSSPEDEQTDSDEDDNTDGGLSVLKPRVKGIEQELEGLKLRLEEGIAEMAALRQEMLAAMSTRPPPSSGNGNGGDDEGGRRQPKRSSSKATGRRERTTETFGAPPGSVGGMGGEEADFSNDGRRGGTGNNTTPPMSAKSSVSYTPPLSPAPGSVHTPPLSPTSDLSPAVSAQERNVTDASDARSENAAENDRSDSDSDSESESNSEESDADDRSRGRRSSSSSRAGSAAAEEEGEDSAGQAVEESDGEESDAASRDDSESTRSEAASDAGSASNSDDGSGSDGDDGSRVQAEEEEGEDGEMEEQEEEPSDDDDDDEESDSDGASARGSVSASERSDEQSDRDNDNNDGGDASDASAEETNPEGSSSSDSENEGGGSADEEGSDSMSERDRPESQRSSSDDEGSTGRRKP